MNKQEPEFSITPETRVGALLDKFPKLEDVLIEMAPAFAKLRNPILRKTVAKVATLRQAAQVGNVPLGTLINRLRSAAGLRGDLKFDEEQAVASSTPPAWFNMSAVVKSFDARPVIEAGQQPMNQILRNLKELKGDQIYELITPFIPAPLIDIAKSKGFQAWSREEESEIVKTYFGRFDSSSR